MHEDRAISPSLLLERARAGDEPALEALLLEHDGALRASIDINAKWRSVIEAEDVLQVTYLEAVLDLRTYRGDAAGFGPWLLRIATNNLRDAIKGLEREKRPHPDRRIGAPVGQDSVLWLWNFLTGGAASPSSVAAREEVRTALETGIAQLPAAYAEVIRLVHFRGRSIEEAASAMGRTYGAVYLLHRRALNRLGGLLGAESQFFSR